MNISVIIPTHNRSGMLKTALDSLLCQDYDRKKYEIIIVDNNSCDDTKNLIHIYIREHSDYNIRYIFEPQDGLVYARHTGARSALFDILSYTDDDAILSPVWLKEIAHVFSLNVNIAAVAGKITIKWDEKPPEWVIPYEPSLGKLDYGDDILMRTGLYINGGNFSIKKYVLDKLGGFNPDQIGEWLIGDGETGLNRKLEKEGYLIGWSPKALMEHQQTVKKNATVADIKRRFINNGISIPYQIYAVKEEGTWELVKNMVSVLINISKLFPQCIMCSVIGNTELKYDTMFRISFNICQIPYTFRILSDQKFRNELRKKYW